MDNTFIIDNLLRQNESEVLEFKTTFSVDIIAKNVTSMLNNRGGDILIGVADNKQVVGMNKAIDTKALLNKLMSEIIPAAPVDVQEIIYDEKKLLLIRVWEGSQKPYSYKGTIYQTIGGHGKSISRIISDRKDSDMNWERMPLLGAEISDLDMDELKKSMEMYQNTGAKAASDPEEYLINNGLIQNGNVTNACALLYAKSPSKFYAQSGIKLSVFYSDSSSDLLEARNYTGNIFKNVDAIFGFLDNYFKKSFVIDAPQRTERWNYPRVAVREGIMNAIIHRDYSNYQGFLQIQIFPSHLDILNFGTMDPIISYANTGIMEYSMLRNPDIAYQCYYRNLIEMRGTGIMRMNDECKKNGFTTPAITVVGDIVKVSFPINQTVFKQEPSNKIESMVNDAFENITQNVKDKMAIVLHIIKNNPGIKSMAISDISKISKKTIDRYLAELKRAGLITYKGANRNGGFYLHANSTE